MACKENGRFSCTDVAIDAESSVPLPHKKTFKACKILFILRNQKSRLRRVSELRTKTKAVSVPKQSLKLEVTVFISRTSFCLSCWISLVQATKCSSAGAGRRQQNSPTSPHSKDSSVSGKRRLVLEVSAKGLSRLLPLQCAQEAITCKYRVPVAR